MASRKTDLEKIAEAAAQGVAIALAARSGTRIRRPKYVFGIPSDLFEVTLELDRSGRYNLSELNAQPQVRGAQRGR